MGKEYIKATIHTTSQGAEALSALLPFHGIDSLSIEDPSDFEFLMASKEKLFWDYIDIQQEQGGGNGEVRVCFWLEMVGAGTAKKIRDIRTALLKLKSGEQYGDFGEDADFGRLWMETEDVKDDWKDKYKEYFHTFSPCGGIIVAPPWESAEVTANGNELKIVIDPGMAFGTGSHETTSMSMRKIKELLRKGDIFLDAGAGSGILSITAAMLGAGSVYAVEIDGDAAESAARNIASNDMENRIQLFIGDILSPDFLPEGIRFNLIAANLSCELIEKMIPVAEQVLAADGKIIITGLLDSQEERAFAAIKKAGLQRIESEISGEWLMLVAER